MYVIENVRDIRNGSKMYKSMCQIRPHPKVDFCLKRRVVFCNTKPLIEVSNHIRPTSEIILIMIPIIIITIIIIIIFMIIIIIITCLHLTPA